MDLGSCLAKCRYISWGVTGVTCLNYTKFKTAS